jgi:hypothetical protein
MNRLLGLATRGLVLLALGGVSAGCSSVSLIQLDNEWARTYEAQARADASEDDLVATLTNFDDQFADLSDRAAREADRAASSDAPTAVGFYRIAALAAWKSGPKREDQVPGLAAKGRRVCASLPAGDASQPRDCAVFRIVEGFALHDREARQIEALVAARSASQPLSEPEQTQALKAHRQLAAAFGIIADGRNAIALLPVDRRFHAYVDRNWSAIYCTAAATSGLVRRAPNLAAATERALRGANSDMEAKLRVARVPIACAGG